MPQISIAKPGNGFIREKNAPMLARSVNLAVLLLSVSDTPRVTTLTRGWVERMTAHVADYVVEQSGGRASLAVQVFDWFELPLTSAEWNDLQFGAGNAVTPLVAKALDVDLTPFDNVALVIDKGDAFSAVTAGRYIHMAARDLTPAILQHELTHVFGTDDSFIDTPTGPARYGDNFCIMGAEGGKYSFSESSLALPTEPVATAHAMSGPGMTATTLMATGWLDAAQPGVGRDLTDSVGPFGVALELAALRGAPGPGGQGPPVFCWIDLDERLVFEYRTRDGGRWDRGIPDPGPDAAGWIVVHRTPLDGPVTTLQVRVMRGAHGESASFGRDNPFEIFKPGPLRVTVRGFDRARGTVSLFLSRRPAREPAGSVPFGGVVAGGGGVIFTPGSGFTPVPPHSPLITIIEHLGHLQQLHTLAEGPLDVHTAPIVQAADRGLTALRASVERLDSVATTAPLDDAVSQLRDLRELQDRLVSSNGSGTAPAVLEAAQASLALVQRNLDRVAADHEARAAAEQAAGECPRRGC